MKTIITILSLFLAGSARAGVPYWMPPMASTHTAYGTGYLSGVLKVYPSTSTAAASPSIQLYGPVGYITATSSITAGAGFYGSGAGLTALPAAQLTGTVPTASVDLSTTQPKDADLTAIAALTPTDNNIIVGNGSAWVAESGDTARTSLGLAIGTDVQAYDADLADLADGSLTGSKVGSGVPAANIASGSLGSGVIASSIALAGFYSSDAVRTALGLAIGTNVQAYDADLADLADGSLTASKVGTGYLSSGLSGTIPTGLVDLSTVTTALGGKENADATIVKEADLTANDFNVAANVVSLDYTNGQAASAANKGFLTSTDWSTFNGKQAAGNYITALTGNVTASGPGSVVATIVSVPTSAVDLSTVTTALNGKQAADADLDDLADGSLTGSKVGPGVPAANIASGSLGASVMASSVAASAFYSADVVRTNLGLAIGTNVQAYDADLADLADGSLSGSKVGDGVPAANIAAGSLDADVIVSSIAASAIEIADGTTLAKTGMTFSAKSSSVTLQGNSFNGASQLVRLDGDTKLPAVDGSALLNLPSTAGGAVLASTQTFTGQNTFVGAVTLGAIKAGPQSESLIAASPHLSTGWQVVAYSKVNASSITFTNLESSVTYRILVDATMRTGASNFRVRINSVSGSTYFYNWVCAYNNGTTCSQGATGTYFVLGGDGQTTPIGGHSMFDMTFSMRGGYFEGLGGSNRQGAVAGDNRIVSQTRYDCGTGCGGELRTMSIFTDLTGVMDGVIILERLALP